MQDKQIMMMRLRDPRFAQAFVRAPLMTQLSVLARLVVQGERAILACMKTLELVSLMGSMLSETARLEIAAQLRDAADTLASQDRHVH
jgi:hypothetical protein